MQKGDLVYHPEFGNGKVLDVYPINNFPIHVIFPDVPTSRTFKMDDVQLLIIQQGEKTMLMQSWDARMKVCGPARASGEDKPCLRHGCMNFEWDPKSVKPKTEITTANKDGFDGWCGLSGEPKCRVKMSGDV